MKGSKIGLVVVSAITTTLICSLRNKDEKIMDLEKRIKKANKKIDILNEKHETSIDWISDKLLEIGDHIGVEIVPEDSEEETPEEAFEESDQEEETKNDSSEESKEDSAK